MESYLDGKVVMVGGGADDAHRAIAVALAQAGADIVVAGTVSDLPGEARLHSIANEIWALSRRSVVETLTGDGSATRARARQKMGRLDYVVSCERVAQE